MRVDRGAAMIVQAQRGGNLDKYMPWGKDVKKDVPSDIKSPAAAVYAYTDKQLEEAGLYRDQKGEIRRLVSNAGKRMVNGKIVDPNSESIRIATEFQQRNRSNMDSKQQQV